MGESTGHDQRVYCSTPQLNTSVGRFCDFLFHDQTEETDGDRTRQQEGWPASNRNAVPKPNGIGVSVKQLAEIQAQRGNRQVSPVNDV